MWHLKKILLSMTVVGAVSCFTIAGTFASLTASTRNNHTMIASGTLTFSNTVTSTCSSFGAGSTNNANPGCDPLFQNTTQMYPGAIATRNVTIANTGSLDVAGLWVYMPSCGPVATPGSPAPLGTVGGGNPCLSGGAQIYIEERDSAFSAGSASCVYPTTGGACGFTTNSLPYLATVANSANTAFSLGAGPIHGASRYFVVGMKLPAGASNTLQGEEAVFALTWHIST
jgi:hypothetical protein